MIPLDKLGNAVRLHDILPAKIGESDLFPFQGDQLKIGCRFADIQTFNAHPSPQPVPDSPGNRSSP